MSSDLKTEALVVHRTNFGETDRIISFLTPSGKKNALAKSVRKEKSKLAGGVELFCLSEITLHKKEGSEAGLNILTSARSKIFYQNLISDLKKLDYASDILKRSARLADAIVSPELFHLTRDCLEGLNFDLVNPDYINIYYILNAAHISGDSINLISDTEGERLLLDQNYSWNVYDKAFEKDPGGDFTANHIKLLRLLLSTNLKTVSRVTDLDAYFAPLKTLANAYS